MKAMPLRLRYLLLFASAGFALMVNAEIKVPATLQSISVMPNVASVAVGQTLQYAAIGSYSDGQKKNITAQVTWKSNAAKVATVTSKGLATGVGTGKAQISASLQSITGSARLFVTPALVSIAVTPVNASIIVGKTEQYTATGTYGDGSQKIITNSVAWSSSATKVVTITSTGLATGVVGGVKPGDPPGQSTISATLDSVQGSTLLTVTDNLTAIAVTPSSVDLPQVGAQQAFTATGTYQDGSQANITSAVNWSTENGCIATIVASGTGAGTATAAGLGTAPITAQPTGSNINGTATVTVGTPPVQAGAILPSFFGMTIGDDNGALYNYPPTANPPIPIGALGHLTELAWATIESKQGVYDFSLYDEAANLAKANGLPFMVTFGWTPYWAVSSQWQQSQDCHLNFWCSAPPQSNSYWTDFITAVVNHYNGTTAPRIQYYEVWNEANSDENWAGSQLGLVTLASLAAPIIHTNSLLGAPSVTDIVGGEQGAAAWLQGYLQTSLSSGATGADFADGGSFHGYLAPTGFTPYPFPEDCSASGYDDIVTRAMTFRNILDTNGLANKPLYDSEGSWGKDNIKDINQQTEWLARWYLLQAGSQVVKSAFWFPWGLSTPGMSGEENQWGQITDDCPGLVCTATAAGVAYGQVYDWLVNSSISPCSPAPDPNNPGNYTWSCSIVNSAKQQELAVWYYSPDESGTSSYTPGSQYTHYQDLTGASYTVSSPITLTAAPILLTP